MGSVSVMNCHIRTCEKTLFSGEVCSITLPGNDGEFMLSGEHAPLLQALEPGLCTLMRPNRQKVYFFLFGGVCYVGGQEVHIVITRGSPLHDPGEDSLESVIKHFRDQMQP